MTRSAQELRLASEESRAELEATVEKLRERIADTADDIRERVSPEHIKSELSGMMRDKTQSWVHGLKQQANENPMQALAAGTAIAIPLLRLARGIPLPLLMIGAGLAFTSKTLRGRVTEAASPALGKAEGIMEEASERTRLVKDRVQDRLFAVQGQAADVTDHVSENIRSQATHAASVVGDKIRMSVDSAKNTAVNAAAVAPEKARQVVGDNATLVGGLGIIVGAILGAAFPGTKVESKAMGRASDNVKQAASEAAQSGFETARDTTISALDAAATKIAEADLGGHASRMTREITDTLQDAADDVERAAFSTSRNSNI